MLTSQSWAHSGFSTACRVNQEDRDMLAYIRKVADRKNDEGASAVEYGLLVAAIAAVIVLVVFALGSVVKSAFDDTCNKVANNGTSAEANDKCN
jgi:pilus assembly protein Flp/PilA